MVEGSSALTMTGEVIGSPEFLAPERALGRTPGPESDLWSLGVMLYAAVEGNSPFRQNTPLSTLRAIVDEELPPPYRAGPLAPVIEGLLRKDPAQRISAEQAEQDLRIVGAGGTPRADAPPVTPYPPAVHAFPAEPPTAPLPSPAQTVPARAAGSATTTTAEPERNRRAAVVLIAGLAALALAIGGLTYALLNGNDGGGSHNNGSTKESGSAGSSSGGNSSTQSSPQSSSGGPSSSSPSSSATTTQPEQSVSVRVTGSHTDYSGSCPPPDAQAPTFTATFTVGRVPVDVDYRWVTKTGEVSDPGWKTLSFPAGGAKTQQKTVIVTTYDAGGTYRNEISVEVRSPLHATSGSVPFSVTCETETPTGGASASTSSSPSAQGNSG
jgi:hypothetical protein